MKLPFLFLELPNKNATMTYCGRLRDMFPWKIILMACRCGDRCKQVSLKAKIMTFASYILIASNILKRHSRSLTNSELNWPFLVVFLTCKLKMSFLPLLNMLSSLKIGFRCTQQLLEYFNGLWQIMVQHILNNDIWAAHSAQPYLLYRHLLSFACDAMITKTLCLLPRSSQCNAFS